MPDEMKELEMAMDDYTHQFNEYRALLADWKTVGLDNQEVGTLLDIFNKLEKETEEFSAGFNKQLGGLRSINEAFMHHKDQMNTIGGGVRSSYKYQEEEGANIEKQFMATRVRGIHYRNQPVKVLAKYEFGLIRVVGYDQDKDQPVEVVKLPKVFPDNDKLNMILNTFDAYKELIFSKYFIKYLGFNTVADPDFNHYYLELIPDPSLADLFANTPYKLTSKMLLFRYWAREIFFALSDLLGMTTYSFKKPIQLGHIFPTDYGTKILFANLNFEEKRCRSSEAQENLEAYLLRNYGKILLEILNYNSVEQMRKEEGLESIELITFIETLLNAKNELKRFTDGSTYYHMTFENTQSHPFFNLPEVIKADVIDLAEEFSRVFPPKAELAWSSNMMAAGSGIGAAAGIGPIASPNSAKQLGGEFTPTKAPPQIMGKEGKSLLRSDYFGQNK